MRYCNSRNHSVDVSFSWDSATVSLYIIIITLNGTHLSQPMYNEHRSHIHHQWYENLSRDTRYFCSSIQQPSSSNTFLVLFFSSSLFFDYRFSCEFFVGYKCLISIGTENTGPWGIRYSSSFWAEFFFSSDLLLLFIFKHTVNYPGIIDSIRNEINGCVW